MSKSKSLIQIHSAVILFGLAGLFGKLLNLPSIIIVLGRVTFASAGLLVLLLVKRQPLKLRNSRDYLLFAGLGLLLAVHWVTFFESIQLSTVGIGLLTLSTFPVFTAILEPFFFHEKFKARDLVLGFVTLLGVALVIPRFSIGDDAMLGALWGIASGATFAVLSILNRRSAQEYSGLIIAFYQDLSAMIILLPFLFILDARLQGPDVALLALLGIVFTGLSHSLFISGLRNVKAKKASVIVTLEPVYGIVAAAMLLDEIPTLRMAIGGMIILCAAVCETLASR